MAKKSNLTYQDLQAQINALQTQAEEVRRQEVAEVVARIREAVAHYGLTAGDLGFGGKARAAGAAAGGKRGRKAGPGRKKVVGVIRYRDDAGHAWTGHGKRPQWFKDALEAGKTPDDLKV